MIDTIHLSVPITWSQYQLAAEMAMARGKNVGVLFKTATHEVWIRQVSDVATLDRGSYERDVFWSVPGGTIEHVPRPDGLFERVWSAPSPPYYLQIQASLPKVYYGHNISLLYEWPKALEKLKEGFKRWFGWRSLPDIKTWKVNRCDFCYTWGLPDGETALEMTEVMKRLKYPHKKPRHYHGTAMWPATKDGGYTVKMYAKGLEFDKHDRPKLEKQSTDHDWIDHLSERAHRLVRFEITGKAKFLRRHNIRTVKDLMGNVVNYSGTPELMEFISSITPESKDGKLRTPLSPAEGLQIVVMIAMAEGHIPLGEDMTCELIDGQTINLPQMTTPLDSTGQQFIIPAGSIELKFPTITEHILETYLFKLVGNGDMSMSDEVKETLNQYYKDHKAARLYFTWLAIQKDGAKETMDFMGSQNYYRDIRELKKAGVTILEKQGVLIKPGNDFWKRFRIEIPSPFVGNSTDDYPDHENLINMAERMNRERKVN